MTEEKANTKVIVLAYDENEGNWYEESTWYGKKLFPHVENLLAKNGFEVVE
jgi:hypothetical protein